MKNFVEDNKFVLIATFLEGLPSKVSKKFFYAAEFSDLSLVNLIVVWEIEFRIFPILSKLFHYYKNPWTLEHSTYAHRKGILAIS